MDGKRFNIFSFSNNIKMYKQKTQRAAEKRDNLIKNPLNSFQQPNSRLTFIETLARVEQNNAKELNIFT